MNIRISQFLTAENITQAQFADTIGVARASISHIIAGRNKPSYDFIASVLKNYPALNPQWLILGKGRMYIDAEQQTAPESKIVIDSPVIPQKTDSQTNLLFPLEDSPASASSIFIDGSTLKPDTGESADGASKEAKATAAPSQESQGTSKRICRILVLFEDGSFQELKNQ